MAAHSSKNRELLYYRMTVGILFFLCIFLAFDGNDSNQELELDEEPLITENLNVAPSPKSRPRRERISRKATRPQNDQWVNVLIDKENFLHYQVLEGIRTGYRGNILSHATNDSNSSQYDSILTTFAIGLEAIQEINRNPPKHPVILLDPQNNLNPYLETGDFYGILNQIPPEIELGLINKIFTDKTQIYFVYDDNQKPPEGNFARDLGVNLIPLAADERLVAGIDTRSPKTTLVWLHNLPEVDLQNLLSLEPLQILDSFAGLQSQDRESEPYDEDADLEDEETPRQNTPTLKPLARLKMSPKGMGLQGALLLRKIMRGRNITQVDQLPKRALQVELSLTRALELGREESLEDLKRRAYRAGLEAVLKP